MAGSAVTDRLDTHTQVVLAPNPSAMTLDGTNTYVVSAPDCDAAIVVDPGPDVDTHFRAVEAALEAAGATARAVVITHYHRDHAEAAGWASRWDADLYAYAPEQVHADAKALADGHHVDVAGLSMEAVHTPGHTSDHLCLRVPATGVVFTGDHVLGRGTTVVLHPDGHMGDYLASLAKLRALEPTSLYPAHGPVITNPDERIGEYLAHRSNREAQVLAAATVHGDDVDAIVAQIYGQIDAQLLRAATATVNAHLQHLRERGAL